MAERRERLRIEALRLLEVADVRCYVVEHPSSSRGPAGPDRTRSREPSAGGDEKAACSELSRLSERKSAEDPGQRAKGRGSDEAGNPVAEHRAGQVPVHQSDDLELDELQ